MAAITPRRSSRIPHNHTPRLSERKKGLFQGEEVAPRESLTMHRKLPVVESESDSEPDLGIISTLDSSSGEDNEHEDPKTPERQWHETRYQTRNLLKENNGLKNFMKSPFTLKKYQHRYADGKCSGSLSMPATPHLNTHPGTPSSTHSCASAHTMSSTSSRARKSLASLIADTESCSSSLKDLSFDTDSGTDSKENTPTRIRRSSRRQKMTPKFHSFKGILLEQKKNISPMKNAVVCLTKMDMSSLVSPTQMLKTPHNTIETESPPKIGHRHSILVAESPESTSESEKSHKRLRNDSVSDNGPNSKYPRLENQPKARLSLFNSDRLKEILSAKSFYGKSNPDMTNNVTTKISNAIEVSTTTKRLKTSHSHRRKRRPGQINLGVRHRIRKPKYNKNRVMRFNNSLNSLNNSTLNSTLMNASADTTLSQNTSQDLGNEKADPFDKEKQTIENLLSQWTEEDDQDTELSFTRPVKDVACFNSTIIEETRQIFQPITAVRVNDSLPQDSTAVIVELGAKGSLEVSMPTKSSELSMPGVTPLSMSTKNSELSMPGVTPLSLEVSMPRVTPLSMPTKSPELSMPGVTRLAASPVPSDVVMANLGHKDSHGDIPNGQFLPVEGGYILVEENGAPAQEELPDLDEIERELKMLDEQILKMAKTNNINAEAVLASTESIPVGTESPVATESAEKSDNLKLFSIFEKPNPGVGTSKDTAEKTSKRSLIKTGSDQYVIDAGQKKFGATQCTECGTIYQIGDPQDEYDHLVHHNATDVLKFNGYKDECVVDRCGTLRCIRIRGGDALWRRVDMLLARVVHPQLGYGNELPKDRIHMFTAYLCIDKNKIVGCLIVEPKVRAQKFIPGDPDCCSVEDYPVKCGVSRLWVHSNRRRSGIASRLLQCARASFLYGAALLVSEIAFSAPTPAGKAFATKYCATENFYVYLD